MPQATGLAGPLPPAYPHDVRAVVLAVRESTLVVLLRRPADGSSDRWALPGGGVGADERLREAVAGHLFAQVGLRQPSYVEQIATHSSVGRDPRARVLATAYLVLTPSADDPAGRAAWHPVDELPPLVLDHDIFVEAAVARLRAKLSYTNIGFALAPAQFTMAELRDIISAALGYEVTATNLNRVLVRRGVIEPSSELTSPGHAGGRPARLFRFTSQELTITDPFAVLKPTDRHS